MVSTSEKKRVLDELIVKYPERAFLKDIRKSYGSEESPSAMSNLDDFKRILEKETSNEILSNITRKSTKEEIARLLIDLTNTAPNEWLIDNRLSILRMGIENGMQQVEKTLNNCNAPEMMEEMLTTSALMSLTVERITGIGREKNLSPPVVVSLMADILKQNARLAKYPDKFDRLCVCHKAV